MAASAERPVDPRVMPMGTCLYDTMNYHAIEILRDTMPIPA